MQRKRKQYTGGGDDLKNDRILLCVSERQKAAIKALADREGMTISAYLVGLALPDGIRGTEFSSSGED